VAYHRQLRPAVGDQLGHRGAVLAGEHIHRLFQSAVVGLIFASTTRNPDSQRGAETGIAPSAPGRLRRGHWGLIPLPVGLGRLRHPYRLGRSHCRDGSRAAVTRSAAGSRTVPTPCPQSAHTVVIWRHHRDGFNARWRWFNAVTRAAENIPGVTGCLGKHYMGSPQQSKGRDRHSDRWADCR
jgi:hypothetical protein